MDQNIAWMLAGGAHLELASTLRDRQNLQAFLESRRATHVSLIDRVRGFARPKPADTDLACRPA